MEAQWYFFNRLSGVLVEHARLLWLIIDLISDRVKPKTIKFVFVASMLSLQHLYKLRRKSKDRLAWSLYNVSESLPLI
jgi:hypothetical protein